MSSSISENISFAIYVFWLNEIEGRVVNRERVFSFYLISLPYLFFGDVRKYFVSGGLALLVVCVYLGRFFKIMFF
jgi:hypothetical protein